MALLLAKRALRPVQTITQTAQSITGDDMSGRITGITTADEVGELADTFNAMLDALEVSFERERRFTSDASHELRTPVTVIAAAAEDALCSDVTGSTAEDLRTIQREAQQMTRIISQLLMLARGYEGRIHFERDTVCLHDMVDAVCQELAGIAETQGICLYDEVPEDLMLACDQSLMTQLLVNLIGNAVKYGRTGGSVWVGAEEGADQVYLTVADDGIGISEEDLPHIFDRFYRADRARDRSGTGLGLAIAKWIAERHGGSIRVQSAQDRGTLFEVLLPKR